MFLMTWPEYSQVEAIGTYLAPLTVMLHPERQSGHVIISWSLLFLRLHLLIACRWSFSYQIVVSCTGTCKYP